MSGTGPLHEGGARAVVCIWRAVCVLALLGTLWFIFSHSAQPAAVSGAQSRGVLALVNRALRGWGLPGVPEQLLRKAAHFAEFTALGISDVLLDGCGVLAGLVLARAAIWAWTRLHGRAEQRK